ncbi:MAG TPA: hypothetical protein VNN18_04590 [Candidatus Xenobia bacterium]|nr:hypothetical protein [Candidatus Xenobia bacterium]
MIDAAGFRGAENIAGSQAHAASSTKFGELKIQRACENRAQSGDFSFLDGEPARETR